MKIEMGKVYKTRDGSNVRLLCTDRRHHQYTVMGLIDQKDCDYAAYWTSNGICSASYPSSDSFDLVEVKPRIKREYWVNLYPQEKIVGVYNEKQNADIAAMQGRIACTKIEIECEEGEGLRT